MSETTILAAINSLTDAITLLTARMVNLNSTINVKNSITCECVIGQGPDGPSVPVEEGPPPPIGSISFEEPAGGLTNERRCDGANYIIASIRNVAQSFEQYGVTEMVSLGLAFIAGVIAPVFALEGLAFSELIYAVGTLVNSIALTIFTGGLDFAEIFSVMSVNYNDLVCALYDANSPDDARQNITDVLDAEGTLNPTEIAFVLALMPNVVLDLIWWDTENSASFFDGYAAEYDCAECGAPEFPFVFQYGTGEFRYDGIDFTLSSQLVDGFYLLNFGAYCNPATSIPNGNWCCEFISHTITLGGGFTRTFSCYSGFLCDVFFQDYPGQFIALQVPTLVSIVNLTWDSPFTITMNIKPDYRGPCTGDPGELGSECI